MSDLNPGMVRDAIRSGFARMRAALEVAEEAFDGDEIDLAVTAIADVEVGCHQFGEIVFPVYADAARLPDPDFDRVGDLMRLFAEGLDRRGYPITYPWNVPREGFT